MRNSLKIFCLSIAIFFIQDKASAEEAKLINPSGCTSKIGNGGNYYSRVTGKLAGKCEGGGLAPFLKNNMIVFSAPKKTEDSVLATYLKDRTELAFNRNLIQYDKDYIFDFYVEVDKNSDITNEFFYLMQIWQSPEYSPIFGLRIDRGTQSRGAFVIRNNNDHLAGKRLVRVDLGHGLKHYRIYMNFGKDLNSHIKIYEDSNLITDWSGTVGYPIEKSTNKSELLILKFGLYKGTEHNKSFKVYFKDVTLKSLN